MAGIGIAKKGLGLLGRSVAGKKAAGKTKKIIKTYSTGRRQTEYVRPGAPKFTTKPKMGKKSGSQGVLFREIHPPKEKSPQLKFKFSYPGRTHPLHGLKKAIKKAGVK